MERQPAKSSQANSMYTPEQNISVIKLREMGRTIFKHFHEKKEEYGDDTFSLSDAEIFSHLLLTSRNKKIMVGTKEFLPPIDFNRLRNLYADFEKENLEESTPIPNMKDEVRIEKQHEVLGKVKDYLLLQKQKGKNLPSNELIAELLKNAQAFDTALAGNLIHYLEWVIVTDYQNTQGKDKELVQRWHAPPEMIAKIQRERVEAVLGLSSSFAGRMEGSQKRKVTRPLSKIRKLFNENQSHSESNQLEGAMENALQTMLEQNIVFPTTPSILSEKLQLPPRKLQKIINLLNLKHAYQSGLQVYLNEVDALLIAFCKDMDIENVVTNADLSRSEIATIKNISSQVYQRFNESNSSPKAS